MSKIKVACATADLSQRFGNWFKDMKIVGHESNPILKTLDLLILTGGADINPRRYRDRPRGTTQWEEERDEREFNIVAELLEVNSTAKILAVCRGIQLMNVYLGGSLHQEVSHPHVHKLKHLYKSGPLVWLDVVNSMHHQALYSIGKDYRDYCPRVLSVEPITGLVEMIIWSERILGTQFHPEFFSPGLGSRFFSIIHKWARGMVNIYEPDNTKEGTQREPDERRMRLDSILNGRLNFTFSPEAIASTTGLTIPLPDLENLELSDEDDLAVEFSPDEEEGDQL